MNSELPLYDSHILITTNSNYTDIFHKKTIFKTLSDEHFLKLLFLQKIKIKSNNFTRTYIYLDDLELNDFNLNPKLLNIAKYSSENFGIFFKNIDLIEKNKTKIINYSKFIDNYKKK
tara:strand:+ start:61 stop:411 length:351 start_codon:yes stop_codon:yes gene_type:complete